jgi:hypothetical protein
MDKEKQIEEMAMTICESTAISCYETAIEIAEHLISAKGYRKASEVADELKRYIRLNEDIAIRCKEENGEQNREYWKGKLSAFKQIRGFIDAELKKKYTEEGK